MVLARLVVLGAGFLETHQAIQESIPKKISANTDYLEGKIDEAIEDNRNHFELMEKKMKMIELYLSIDFSKKLLQIEETLGQKIDDNSERLTNIGETLASLLKA
ncbi:hypothetical protein Dimus_029519 [Dionaea muscipula]